MIVFCTRHGAQNAKGEMVLFARVSLKREAEAEAEVEPEMDALDHYSSLTSSFPNQHAKGRREHWKELGDELSTLS